MPFYPDPYSSQNGDHNLVAMDDKLPAPLPAPLRDLLRQKLARRLEAGAERSWLPML